MHQQQSIVATNHRFFPEGKPVAYETENKGAMNSFGFASFGSPVVIHLGSTGFFEGEGLFWTTLFTTKMYFGPRCLPQKCILDHTFYHLNVFYTTLFNTKTYFGPNCLPRKRILDHTVYHKNVFWTTLFTT